MLTVSRWTLEPASALRWRQPMERTPISFLKTPTSLCTAQRRMVAARFASFNPKTGQIRCFEALLRWFHPRLGEIPATDFVPLAEESGLIASLGQWVLQTACAEAVKWPKALRVAVNLSSIQFKNMNLVKVILGALATSGLQASRLE